MNRRHFLAGLFAPAVVSATSIMPIRAFDPGFILMPYKAKVTCEAGIFYAPYIPFEVVKTVITAKPRVLKAEYRWEPNESDNCRLTRYYAA